MTYAAAAAGFVGDYGRRYSVECVGLQRRALLLWPDHLPHALPLAVQQGARRLAHLVPR